MIKRIKTIVVEDEEGGMDNILLKLEQYCPEIEVVAKCYTGEEAVQAILDKRPQLLLLDILLGTMTGFDVLAQIQHVSPEVIFTTSSKSYGIEAVKANAVDYILKPIRPSELSQAVQNAITRIERKGEVNRIVLPSGKSKVVIRVDDIMYCLADNVNTYIHRRDERPFFVVKTLKAIQAMLPENKFHRVSRKALVNLDYVSSFHRSEGGYVVMKDDKQVYLVKSRIDQFLKKLSGSSF